MATEQMPIMVPREHAEPEKNIDEISPKSVIPPHPTVTSPTSPSAPPENFPTNDTALVAIPPPKSDVSTEEGHGVAQHHPAATEATSSMPLVVTTAEGGSRNRDEALAKVNQDRTLSHIRAWEENEKAKSLNKFNRVVAKINAWENTRKATAEAKLKKAEEKLEKKRAQYVEKMKNKIAAVHRQAEEKRAMAEAKKGEEHVQAEETAARYKAAGQPPKKFLCFGA
eukprot:c3316_g1_i1 orf=275-949(+)